ncbi:MAG: biotin transporter BioY [Lachnospiraceae bacterium]|nr:biotin transporter BioY [Lachnospiraceae bacterium]
MHTSSNKILSMVYIALMAVIIAVCSWISIPGPVPFTLQTFAVFSALLLLGTRDGILSITVYLLLGAVGVPVFSGFSGGFSHIAGPTGGYLIGFLVMGFIYGIVTHLLSFMPKTRSIIALILGLIVCYAFGTVWFVIVYSKVKTAIGFGSALSMCVLPFLIPDAVKMALAIILSYRVKALVPALKERNR